MINFRPFVLLLTALVSTIKIYSIQPAVTSNDKLSGCEKNPEKADSIEWLDDYPIFSFEYMISSPQAPFSDSCNLSMTNSHFSAFQANFNYGWYLDKKKERTVLLASLGYALFKTNFNMPETDVDIPNYINAIPNLHHLYLNLIYNQKLKHNWEISGSGSLSLASGFSHKLSNVDYNINFLVYAQKKFERLSLGGGYVTYLIGNNIKGLPIGHFSYWNKKIKCEILAPLSASVNYKFRKRNMILFTSEFDFDGFSIKDEKTTYIPDYADITNFEICFSYDRAFLEKLHWNVGIGYFYREMTFLENNQEVDRLLFDETLFLKTKIYCTF
jgi:hypothetical protein